MRRAVFLDRDGVINRGVTKGDRPFAPASLSEVEIVPGGRAALAELHRSNFALVVVTNQPDVPRGTITREQVTAIHASMMATLPLDAIMVCYHDDEHRCACRKPKPGMLYAA